ncbi:MAG TPA: DMT family transporter [Rhizobiales bacterium]|nr:DMT family transporter [Hyphomicrobiales bacterium]
MNNVRPHENLKAHAAMLLFSFLVSTSFTVGRAITFALDPAALTFLRFSMAIVIFSGVAWFSKEVFKWPSLRDWLRYFFLALLLVIFFVSMFEGLRWTTPLAAGAVFTLTPVMTAVIARLWLGQRPGPVIAASLLIASLASIWIMFSGDLAAITGLKIGRGEVIFLIGCASYAAYTPAVKKLHVGGGLVYLTLWTLVAGAILLLAYGWSAITTTNWHLVSPVVYLAVGWLAFFTTAITFYLVQYGAMRLPGVKVMSYTLLIPAFILLQRLVSGGSWPGASVVAALAVLAVAMLVLQRAPSRSSGPAGR